MQNNHRKNGNTEMLLDLSIYILRQQMGEYIQ